MCVCLFVQSEEIDVVKKVGDAMVSVLGSIEKNMYSDQVSAMENLKPLSSSLNENLEQYKSDEDAGN